jgi:DNA-binding NtrC family response regulator
MQVLLTFTGFHDPFSPTVVETARQSGPVLSILHNLPFDGLYLFDTPGAHENTLATRDEIKDRFPALNVHIKSLAKLRDPTDHLGILSYLRDFLPEIVKTHPDAKFTIALSSGTPAMHACWLLVAADGTIPARLIYGHPPKHIGEEYRISEVDLAASEFPHIEPRVCETPETYFASTPDLEATCEELKIVGDDNGFVEALQMAARVARYDSHVLLLGETGTGKEHFAKLIHHLSGRPGKPFVVMNCAAAPKELVESMLFGHKKGAFTGAAADQKGEFDNADGGTLFLDEIAELPTPSQSKLLRVLQDGMVKPLGAAKEHKVNVRVVAATNADIPAAIKSKQFRLDLSKRFGVRIGIPPLRKRRGDIVKLATFALERWNRVYGESRKLSRDALEQLQAYPWPGNVRELISTVETSAMIAHGRILKAQDLKFDEPVWDETPEHLLPEPHEGFSLKEYLNNARDGLICRALELSHGNRSQAGRLLGITPQAVHRYVKETGIETT